MEAATREDDVGEWRQTGDRPGKCCVSKLEKQLIDVGDSSGEDALYDVQLFVYCG